MGHYIPPPDNLDMTRLVTEHEHRLRITAMDFVAGRAYMSAIRSLDPKCAVRVIDMINEIVTEQRARQPKMRTRIADVTWPRGTARMIPSWDSPSGRTQYYDGDAPTSHPAFRDAVLIDSTWHLMARYPSPGDAEYCSNDKIRHLASWSIKAKVTIK